MLYQIITRLYNKSISPKTSFVVSLVVTTAAIVAWSIAAKDHDGGGVSAASLSHAAVDTPGKGKEGRGRMSRCPQGQPPFGHRPPPPPNIVTDLNGIKYPPACYDGRDGTAADPYHVFVLGDWGGIVDVGDADGSDEKKSSMHLGHDDDDDGNVNIHPLLEFLRGPGVDQRPQHHVRDRMVQLAAETPPEFILNVGDSFYPGGIAQHCLARRSDVDDNSNAPGGGLFHGAPPGQFLAAYENFYKDDEGVRNDIRDATGYPSTAGSTGATTSGLNDKEWLGVLGNHDYGGVCYNMGWAQQIWYTWSRHPLSSKRWVMPAQYYSRRVEFATTNADTDHNIGANDAAAAGTTTTTADLFFLDTNFYDTVTEHGHDICGINGNTYNVKTAPPGEEAGWHCKGYLGDHTKYDGNGVCEGTNFTSPEACAGTFERLWEEQLVWLEDGLNSSHADWQIIVTHYPPYYHAIAREVRPLARRYGVDLIVSGHVHAQELYPPNAKGGVHGQDWGGTAIVVSGGGGGIISEPSEGHPRPDGNDNRYGFMDLAITADAITVSGYSWNAKDEIITVTATAAAALDYNMTSTSAMGEEQVDGMPSEVVHDAKCVGTYHHADAGQSYHMGYTLYKGGTQCVIYHSNNKVLGWVLSDSEQFEERDESRVATDESWVASNGNYKISNKATSWAMNPLRFGMEPPYEYKVSISAGSMNRMLHAKVGKVGRSNATPEDDDDGMVASKDPCDESCYSRGASYTCRDRVERIAWDLNKGGPTYAVRSVNAECVGQCECAMPVADYIVAEVPDFEVNRFVDQRFGPHSDAMKNIPYFYVRWSGFDLLDHTSIEWSDEYPNGTMPRLLMQELYLHWKNLTVDEYRERVQLWTPKSARSEILEQFS